MFLINIGQQAEQESNKNSKPIGPSQGERKLSRGQEYVLLEIVANRAQNPPATLGIGNSVKIGQIGKAEKVKDKLVLAQVVDSIPHLLGFQKTFLDLLTMLFCPVKVPSKGSDFLLHSCLAYCDNAVLVKKMEIVQSFVLS